MILLARLQIVGRLRRQVELSDLESVHIKTLLNFSAFLHKPGIEFRRGFHTGLALGNNGIALPETDGVVIGF